MLKEGIIEPTVSAYASPIVLCRKNNGKPVEDPEAWRFAIDYRKLNSITNYPQYPLPVIDELLANITTTKFMSTLDLTSGYFQIAMDTQDMKKTAFITKNGLFAFKRMPFGLSGAPATFQRVMDKVLKPILGKFVHVYLDDIIIVSETFEEHLKHLTQVFELLRNAGLTLKQSKCHFARAEIKYLGVRITQEGIKIDEEKITVIKGMEAPKTAKQVARFLGMAGWYQKFIPQYAKLCEPLYALKRKRRKFCWSEKAQEAFEAIKQALISPPVLAHPNYAVPFEVYTDASSCGIGAVLSQKGRPIAYAARTLNQAERNYTIIERECLAVIWGLDKFRCYFGKLPVHVITDHSALTKLTNGRNLSARMVRWSLKLAEYNIRIEHRPGSQNVVADLLSRSFEGECVEEVQCDVLSCMVLESREQLIREQENDPEFGAMYRYLKDPEQASVASDSMFLKWSQDFKLVDGLLFYSKVLTSRGELKVVIPGSLQKAILKEFHDNQIAGHFGIRKTYSRILDSCYFKNMKRIVTDYVSSCDKCQKYNYKNLLPAGKLMPIKVSYPLEIVGLDLIGPYPLSNPDRHRYVLVITDYFSKWVEFIPLRKASSRAVAQEFYDKFISKYGAPVQVVSDHGSQFVGKVFEALCRKLDIAHVKTVAYRPQSNQSERVNRNLVQMIATYIGKCHSNWDHFIQSFAYAIRSAVHDTTGKTPAELFLGRKLLTPFQRLVMVEENEGQFRCDNMEQLVEEARQQVQEAQRRQARYYNMKRRVMEIKVGDMVLLETHVLSSAAKKVVGKFGPKFEGPYEVLKVVQNNLILFVKGKRITVNVDQVRVYKIRPPHLSSGSTVSLPSSGSGEELSLPGTVDSTPLPREKRTQRVQAKETPTEPARKDTRTRKTPPGTSTDEPVDRMLTRKRARLETEPVEPVQRQQGRMDKVQPPVKRPASRQEQPPRTRRKRTRRQGRKRPPPSTFTRKSTKQARWWTKRPRSTTTDGGPRPKKQAFARDPVQTRNRTRIYGGGPPLQSAFQSPAERQFVEEIWSRKLQPSTVSLQGRSSASSI